MWQHLQVTILISELYSKKRWAYTTGRSQNSKSCMSSFSNSASCRMITLATQHQNESGNQFLFFKQGSFISCHSKINQLRGGRGENHHKEDLVLSALTLPLFAGASFSRPYRVCESSAFTTFAKLPHLYSRRNYYVVLYNRYICKCFRIYRCQ